MLKTIKKVTILLIIYSITCKCIYTSTKEDTKKFLKESKIINLAIPKVEKNNNDDKIGSLTIEKLNIYQPIYPIANKKNNVDQNVTVLEGSISPAKENSIFFLAAHSGSGKIAYFKNLNYLAKKDQIKLEYKSKAYYYEVKEIWEIKKNGSITVPKEDKNQLVLTTCSPTKEDYQLIINCIQKKSI